MPITLRGIFASPLSYIVMYLVILAMFELSKLVLNHSTTYLLSGKTVHYAKLKFEFIQANFSLLY